VDGSCLRKEEVGGSGDDDGETEDHSHVVALFLRERIDDLELEVDDTVPAVIAVGLVDGETVLAVLAHLVSLARFIAARESDSIGAAETLSLVIAVDVAAFDEAVVVELELVLNEPVASEVPVHGELDDEHLAGLDEDGLERLFKHVGDGIGGANLKEVASVKIIDRDLLRPGVDVVLQVLEVAENLDLITVGEVRLQAFDSRLSASGGLFLRVGFGPVGGSECSHSEHVLH